MLVLLDRVCGKYLQRKIVAVSEDLAGILERYYSKNQICVIENGIDLSAIHREHPSSPTTDKDQKTFKIGLAGRLVPVKRVDLFIQTAQHFVRDHPDI
ncbi:MAG: hypothetical protein ACN4GR_06165 [Arenicellales bacterium]